jgi:hypothetical protein
VSSYTVEMPPAEVFATPMALYDLQDIPMPAAVDFSAYAAGHPSCTPSAYHIVAVGAFHKLVVCA